MASMVEMPKTHIIDIFPKTLKTEEKFEIKYDTEKNRNQTEKEENTDKDRGCEEDEASSPTKEWKMDMENTAIRKVTSDIITSSNEKKVSLPAEDVATCSPTEDFSQEKDAPEVTQRVYDFNMVKQKTLPRISFGNKDIFRAFSSQSKSYIILWTLMPISLVICIVILVLYWM